MMRTGAFRYLPLSILLLLVLPRPLRAQDAQPDTAVLKIAGATIDVALPGESMKLSRQELLDWVRACARVLVP